MPSQKKRIAILILAISMGLFAQESRLLSEGKKFLPTPTEAGFIVNAINVYVQVSQFVRATNELIRSITTAGESFKEFTKSAKAVYDGVKTLKNIDPYNMATWNMHISSAQWAVTMEMNRAKLAFDVFDYKIIGAPADYLKEITTLEQYNIVLTESGKFVKEIYLQKAKTGSEVIEKNYVQTLARLSGQLLTLEKQCKQTKCDKSKLDQIAELRRQKNNLESILLSAEISGNKQDSLVRHAQDVIAINVTELKAKRERMKQLEVLTSELMGHYNTLKGGKVDATPQVAMAPDAGIDNQPKEGYDPDDPDKVPLPAPNMEEEEAELDDEVNHGDVLGLQNQIEFTMLQQESLARDIQIMTLNAIATVTALEAFKRMQTSDQMIKQAIEIQSRFANVK